MSELTLEKLDELVELAMKGSGWFDLETGEPMNPDTGAIATFETKEDAKAAGYTIELEPDLARKLLSMSRHDRRAWLSRAIRSENLHRIVDADNRRRARASTAPVDSRARAAELEEKLRGELGLEKPEES